jgi:hypothetical protein
VAPLHIHAPLRTTLSYVDDFAFTVASKSARHNALLLQTADSEIQTVGSAIEVGFSIAKTELMHWNTVHNLIPPTPNSTISTSGHTFTTKDNV